MLHWDSPGTAKRGKPRIIEPVGPVTGCLPHHWTSASSWSLWGLTRGRCPCPWLAHHHSDSPSDLWTLFQPQELQHPLHESVLRLGGSVFPLPGVSSSQSIHPATSLSTPCSGSQSGDPVVGSHVLHPLQLPSTFSLAACPWTSMFFTLPSGPQPLSPSSQPRAPFRAPSPCQQLFCASNSST